MFTTGSKLFFGGTVLSLVAMVVYGIGTEWQEYNGWVLLGSLAVVTAFLGGVVIAFRDANISAPAVEALSAADAEGRSAQGSASGVPNAMWPLLVAFGAGLLVIGLVLDWRLFLLGLVLLVGGGVEWAVQAWADRASADPAYNARLRGRLMHPIEFPVLGVLAGGLVVFGFSRVMLALSKEGSIWAFIGLGIVILAVAAILAARPRLSSNLLTVLLLIGGVGILTAGIVGIAQGERSFAHGEEAERVGNQVADKAGATATFVYEDGALTPERITVGRSVVVNVLFENRDDVEQRLVVTGPEVTTTNEDGAEVTEPAVWETSTVGQDQRALLTFQIGLPGTYEIAAEGEGPAATAELVVP